MTVSWHVSPYFFDQYDMSLTKAAPKNATISAFGEIKDRKPESLLQGHQNIFNFTETQLAQGNIPFSVAGDCMASLPVMSAVQNQYSNAILIWLDAHGDFNTPETSPQQFLGGMPLAMMVGRGILDFAMRVDLTPVKEEDVYLFDARDLDPLEAVALKNSNVNHLKIEQLAAMKFDRPIHLHIDNDVINNLDVPANNYPVQGGMRLEPFIKAVTQFTSNNPIKALSFSGWNGLLDEDGKTAQNCAKMLSAIEQSLTD